MRWAAAFLATMAAVPAGSQGREKLFEWSGGQITEMGASGKAICRSGRNLYVSTSNGIRGIRL